MYCFQFVSHEFLTFDIMFHTKAASKLIGNLFFTPIIFKKSLSKKYTAFLICVLRI